MLTSYNPMAVSRPRKWLLALVSGVLLTLAWPPLPFFPFLFIGFVPILWLEAACSSSPRSAKCFFGYSYLALLIWNFGTTWWVGATYFGTQDISTAIAGLIANTANPLLMCIPLLGFHRTKKRLGPFWGYLSLPAYWITFEFIHLRWDLSWPWLTLGNGLAKFPQVIQWYEVTGVFGGTLWILAANILLYRLLENLLSARLQLVRRKNSILLLVVLLLPPAASLIQYFTYHEKGKPKQVVVVQPNIDPYNEKFDRGSLQKQINTLVKLSEERVNDSTDYVVWPETAIPQGIMLSELHEDPVILALKKTFAAFPRLELITGINAYQIYDHQVTPTTRVEHENDGTTLYYDEFNTAIQLDTSQQIPYYHKSKLVPGVEKMPYPQLFRFLEPLAINMGGISGSLGEQKTRTVFFSKDKTGAAPLICYESIYGEYCNEYVRRGANLLFVITNDGWWGNTAGHVQHLEYARLRAIETRRDVAQSANTGTSAFISQRGDIYDTTPWWEPAVISATLHANSGETFYVRFGDYLGRLAILITGLLVAFTLVVRYSKKSKSTNGA